MQPIIRLAMLGLVSAMTFGTAGAQAGGHLLPRVPLPKTPVSDQLATLDARLIGRAADIRILVKFSDSVAARANSGGGVHSQSGVPLSAAQSLADDHSATFKPGIDIGDVRLESLLDRAAARSGHAQPDLLGLIEVVLPPQATLEERIILAEAFQSLPSVEFVTLMPPMSPAGDIAPTTPLLESEQTYRHPNPGIDVDFAWSLGLRGAGVRLSDVEYAWNTAHEDLVDVVVIPEPGQTPTPLAISLWQDHGTAVLGALMSAVNDYGCTGMAPEVKMGTYPSLTVGIGHREEDAVAAAIADSKPGDVVLAELQASPGAPAETVEAMWLVVSVAKDAGVVVVEAAGNADLDLDKPSYQSYMSWGDSGAIIVGAGAPTTLHNKLSFSTYGSRVNVQGWGHDVFSLGYGVFAQYGGDPNQEYTNDFNGTSSASAIVTAAVVLLEEYAKQTLLAPLDPLVLRQLLIETGIPQGIAGAKHIGPLPNIAAAIAGMPTPWLNLGSGLAGSSGVPVITAKGSLAPLTPVEFGLDGALQAGSCWLIIGATTDMLPFKGGTLVPHPDAVLGPLVADDAGAISLVAYWPSGLLPDTTIALQWWVKDAAGVKGFAASDGVMGTTP